MSIFSRLTSDGPISRDTTGLDLDWPNTWEAWQLLYSRREDFYRNLGYTVEEMKEWGLFRALDDSGKVIAQTRQLSRDIQHVIDTDSAALSAGWRLQPKDGDEMDLEDGQAVWKRSALDVRRALLTLNQCKHGRVGVEAWLDDEGQGRLNVIDARHYRAQYEDDGVTLKRVYISIPYYDDPTLTPTGVAQHSGTLHTYVRELTPETVRTWIDGRPDEAASGEHGLGVVPFANIRFIPAGDTQHGLWAAHALESPLAAYDSIFAQITAIGNRMGNPIPWVSGAQVDGDSMIGQFGRWISGIPDTGSVGYLEPSLAGLKVLLDSANQARLTARETMPEFLFAGAGAGSSGDALRWRASAFELKVGAVRERLFAHIARMTDIAVRYERNDPYQPDEDLFRVTGAPLLPVDMASELATLETAGRLGMRSEDQIRHLQRLGFIGDEYDAESYALESADQRADTARAFFAQAAPAPTDEEGG